MIKDKEIFDYIQQFGSIRSNSFEDKGVKWQTLNRRLRRMYKSGKLTREKGDNNDWLYFLPVIYELDFSSPDQILEGVLQYARETNHEILNVIPIKYGGKVEGGSGQLSAFKKLLTLLAEIKSEGYYNF